MPTREPAGAATAGKLEAGEVVDTADTTTRAPAPKLSGKRVRAIPAVITKSGDRGTTVEIRVKDFESVGLSGHKKVVFDARKDQFTVGVGDGDNQLSQEAAELLTSRYPTSFEYLDQG